jgi:DNA-directed RNA polymerase specialized sigma24 family protein
LRTFEDSILERITLEQTLEELPAVQVLSFILQIMGYSQSEIAEVGDRHQQGIKYHVDKVKNAIQDN